MTKKPKKSKRLSKISQWVSEAEEYRCTHCKTECHICEWKKECAIPTYKNVWDDLGF